MFNLMVRVTILFVLLYLLLATTYKTVIELDFIISKINYKKIKKLILRNVKSNNYQKHCLESRQMLFNPITSKSPINSPKLIFNARLLR